MNILSSLRNNAYLFFARTSTRVSADDVRIMRRLFTSGFTLIELLVVIAIIGLLSSIVLASLSTAKTKAQDATRKTDLKALENALEIYYDVNHHYPAGGCDSSGWSYSYTCPATFITGLTPTFIGALPAPPGGSTASNYFVYSSRASDSYQSYKLMTYRPATETVNQNSPWARCAASCSSLPASFCATSGDITNGSNANYYSVSQGSVAPCGY